MIRRPPRTTLTHTLLPYTRVFRALEDRDLRRQAALAIEDRLDRLGDAVAVDLVRPEARHQPDQQPADHRDRDDREPDRGIGDRGMRGREAPEQEEVRRTRSEEHTSELQSLMRI